MYTTLSTDLPNPERDPVVGPILSGDRSLRPVFMVSLDKSQVGDIDVVQPGLLPQIGGLTTLEKYTTFLMSDRDEANRLAQQGRQVHLGVVDRYSKDCTFWGGMMSLASFRVANGRQAHFRMADGTWLGVKGSGQHQREDQPSFYLAPSKDLTTDGLVPGLTSPEDEKWLGLLPSKEYAQIQPRIAFLTSLKDDEQLYFAQHIASRALLEIPCSADQVVATSTLLQSDGTPLDPRLSFYRTIHPHRMNKLPQLLKADPGLVNLSMCIGETLRSIGYLTPDQPFSPAEMFEIAFKNMGGAEGKKFAAGLTKETLHLQDINFVGQEADLEELIPIEYLPIDDEQDRKYFGIWVKLGELNKILQYVDAEARDLYDILLADRNHLFKIFWAEFFKHLPSDELAEFTSTEIDSTLSQLLPDDLRWEIWHRSNLPYQSQDDDARDEVREDVAQWARDELLGRVAPSFP